MKFLIFLAFLLASNCLISQQTNSLPINFTWSNVNNTNYLTLTRNQHSPQYCEAGWSFALTSSLSDRIKIQRKAQWPDIYLAPQILLSCDEGNDGCHGGDPMKAYAYIKEHNITDETCCNYQAWGRDNGLPCSQSILCSACFKLHDCILIKDYYIYTISDYGSLAGEAQMMNEIKQRGPISCGVYSKPLLNYSSGIMNTSEKGEVDHVVSVVGWGVSEGVKYWIARNSWGQPWGEQGFFRIVRGENQLQIEGNCSFAVPVDTWTNGVMYHVPNSTIQEFELNKTKNKVNSETASLNNLKSNIFLQKASQKPIEMVIKTPQPYEYLSANEIPSSWDWRNVSGVNYCSWNINQINPHHCPSCWAQGVVSSLSDRFNILQKRQFPDTALAVQMLINCNGGGVCRDGGSPLGAFKFIYQNGISHQSCQQYRALNATNTDCSAIQKCSICTPPVPFRTQGMGAGNCNPVTNYTNYYVSEYGAINGIAQMKAEIYARGPIACDMVPTPELKKHFGWGIYSQTEGVTGVDEHTVSVVGWGVENGTEYWIVRQSWGNYWGYYDFMRLNMNVGNMEINDKCFWGVPSFKSNY